MQSHPVIVVVAYLSKENTLQKFLHEINLPLINARACLGVALEEEEEAKKKNGSSSTKEKSSYSLAERILDVPVLANECVLDELLISP